MEDYLKAIEGQNVVKAIYEEIAVPPEMKEKEARWALELCEDPGNPTVGAIISGNLPDEAFPDYIKAFEGNPHLKGLRYFFKGPEEILHPRIIDHIRLLGELGLAFDISLPPEWYGQGRQLMDECPGTLFVLNHCGRADPVAFFPEGKEAPREPMHTPELFLRGLESLGARENIICKISGIVSHVPGYPLTAADLAPIIDHCFEVFGDERVIFAGDWPVCLLNMPLARWIATLKEVVAGRSPEFRRKLFHDNAERIFKL
jgi:predicted TIM-barrel fold metal-dependent hydrolase